MCIRDSYKICAACSTKEKAEEARRLYRADNIEEWELDEHPGCPPDYMPYYVVMDLAGDAGKEDVGYQFEKIQQGWKIRTVRRTGPKYVLLYVLARDEEHAVKIAGERRRAMMAEGSWGLTMDEWRQKGADAVKALFAEEPTKEQRP